MQLPVSVPVHAMVYRKFIWKLIFMLLFSLSILSLTLLLLWNNPLGYWTKVGLFIAVLALVVFTIIYFASNYFDNPDFEASAEFQTEGINISSKKNNKDTQVFVPYSMVQEIIRVDETKFESGLFLYVLVKNPLPMLYIYSDEIGISLCNEIEQMVREKISKPEK